MEETGKEILLHYAIAFDAGDPGNGSLYLCVNSTEATAVFEPAIARLRDAELWSQEAYSQIKDSQRAVYSEQLRFIASEPVQIEGCPLLLARFDHPKYPSSAERFDAWVTCLSAA